MNGTPTLHPVILAVPEAQQMLKGRPRVAALRKCARDALALSARHSGMRLGALEKDANGAPLPSNGVFWSLSHKTALVAAVVSTMPVGIDVERFKPVSEGLVQRLADASEWTLAPQGDPTLFFRYWTAKEAVLKAVGKGLVDLSLCRIKQVVTQERIVVTYGSQVWTVTHCPIGTDHLVGITADPEQVTWHPPGQ
jgi:4'-phosphopantetheinyl transferase